MSNQSDTRRPRREAAAQLGWLHCNPAPACEWHAFGFETGVSERCQAQARQV